MCMYVCLYYFFLFSYLNRKLHFLIPGGSKANVNTVGAIFYGWLRVNYTWFTVAYSKVGSLLTQSDVYLFVLYVICHTFRPTIR